MSGSVPNAPSLAARLPGAPDFVTLGDLPVCEQLTVRAMLLGARIDTRDVMSDIAVVQAAAATGLIFVFRYGVAVFFGPAGLAAASFEAALKPHVLDPAAIHETETASLSILTAGEDRIGPDGRILLANGGQERLSLVATVLARSVVLARDEILVSEAFDRSAPLVAELHENGRARSHIREVMKLVGNVLAARHRVMGTAQAGERPDLLWDHPELDRLYARLETEYELKERAEVLERKFGALGDFTEVLLDIVQDKRAFRLEIAIIALIAFEILLTLFDMTAR